MSRNRSRALLVVGLSVALQMGGSIYRASAASDPNAITLHAPFSTFVAGEVLRLNGKQRFSAGQLQSIRVFVGEKSLEFVAPSASELQFILPQDLPAGPYTLTVVKHADNSGRDITEFSQVITVESGVRTQIAATSAGLSATQATVMTVGPVELEFPPGQSVIDLTVAASPLDRRYLEDEENQEGIPPLAADLVIEVTASEPLTGTFALRLTVPDSFAARLPADATPDLYVFEDGCDGYEFRPLHAAYNPLTHRLVASIGSKYMTPAEDCASETTNSTTRRAATTAIPVSKVKIQLGIKAPKKTVCGIVSGAITSPGTNTVTIPSGAVVPLAGDFTLTLPRQLHNPTRYNILSASGGIVVSGSTYKPGVHEAIDLHSTTGDPAYAAENGTIIDKGFMTPIVRDPAKMVYCGPGKTKPLKFQSTGHFVRIRHDDGSLTKYSHLVDTVDNAAELPVNGQVAAGQEFAKTDNTGYICAEHLHFSYYMCKFDSVHDAIDPRPWLRADAPDPKDYVKAWSFLAALNGVLHEETRKYVSTPTNYTYSAQLSTASAALKPKMAYPVQILMDDGSGNTVPVYTGAVTVTGVSRLRLVIDWDPPNPAAAIGVYITDGTSWDVTWSHVYDMYVCGTWMLLDIPNSAISPLGSKPIVFTVDPLPASPNYAVYVYNNGCATNSGIDHTATLTLFGDDDKVPLSIENIPLPRQGWFTRSFPQ